MMTVAVSKGSDLVCVVSNMDLSAEVMLDGEHASICMSDFIFRNYGELAKLLAHL